MAEPLVHRPLSVVGAPSSAGAYGPGQELAPATFRRHGLVDALRDAGLDVNDRGDGRLVEWQPDAENPTAANAGLVGQVATRLATTLANVFAAGHNVLVLGGDCTIELGTVAGAQSDGSTVGLVYIDLDADLNTPATGDGILDWMGVAHLLDVPGAHDSLATIGGQRPMLQPHAVRLFSTANVTPPEAVLIEDLSLKVECLSAVAEQTKQVLARTHEWARAYDRLLVHVDIDVLDYEKFPIAENTDRRGGLDLATLTGVLIGLCSFPNWRALTLTEVNPRHAPHEERSFNELINMLTSALAGHPSGIESGTGDPT